MTIADPAIAILPYGSKITKAIAGLPLDQLDWPLGCPDRLQGGRVSDLTASDHLIVYANTALHIRSVRGCSAKVSLMVLEPKVISAKHHLLLRLSQRRFFRVFAYDEELLAAIPNGLFLPFGTTWVPDWQDLRLAKTKNLSLIASNKRDHTGHKLRHQMVDYLGAQALEADIMGRGYTPFDKKSDGLAPYRYSVVIENVQERNYFSEKLIDAILCETVPIYWGCPNITDFFECDGMILCRDQADIEAALSQIGPTDYACRLQALRTQKTKAAVFANLHLRAAETLRDSL